MDGADVKTHERSNRNGMALRHSQHYGSIALHESCYFIDGESMLTHIGVCEAFRE